MYRVCILMFSLSFVGILHMLPKEDGESSETDAES